MTNESPDKQNTIRDDPLADADSRSDPTPSVHREIPDQYGGQGPNSRLNSIVDGENEGPENQHTIWDNPRADSEATSVQDSRLNRTGKGENESPDDRDTIPDDPLADWHSENKPTISGHGGIDVIPGSAPPPTILVGVPGIHIFNNQLIVGSSQSRSTRSYTELKTLGDGSFGTVYLCDWHGTLPPNTPLSPMQCGPGAKPEWAGKRLVAVKRMRKKWAGGWDECKKLKELESLRAIPFHPNIIPLYDVFLQPDAEELYIVFEAMEGNLHHLIKARKGRPFAGGLTSSIFRQMVSGLDHIHSSGYFHRDMKPENILITTTGLHNYTSVSPTAPPNAPPEMDVVAIVKLADFGLARELRSLPPYTEYVSARWYRAPEVVLMSNNYSSPVDMWALGTIVAELINLSPLFPGIDTMDQLSRICDILGDPSDVYGVDAHNNPVGGGPWPRGVQLADSNGFAFRKFPAVPVSLVHCIRDLLKYEPGARLTSRQCLDHPYLRETTPLNGIHYLPTTPRYIAI
ncbi:kinase-like domain-containing protein [Mycena leptocephala]|nr:kinase-like domain-containing protein [Mycena leptocephala]